MPRIALVDHSERGIAPNLILVLRERGHEAEQFDQEDPAEVVAAVGAWNPDLVCADPCFEGIDDPLGDKWDWWGITVLRLLRAQPGMEETVLAADSKYIDRGMEAILDQLNIPPDARIRVFAANANLKHLANRLEALCP